MLLSLSYLTALVAAVSATTIPADAQQRRESNASSTWSRCSSNQISSILNAFKSYTVTVTLESATHVPANGSYGEGARNLGVPQNATGLPELCAAIVRVQNNTADPPSDFRFGVFLPTGWNGRLLAVGNGAFLGGINWPAMGTGPHYGFATISTDTGHNSGPADLSWGLDEPAALLDWGYRAVRGSTIVAKKLVAGYYGRTAARSYFTGCSTGGRQGLKAIQDDPDAFDGALVGAPAYDTKNLMPWVARVGKANLRPDAGLIFNPADTSTGGAWDTLVRQVLIQCDGADGVLDGIVSAPAKCQLNFTLFTCPTDTTTLGCLTPAQIQVVKTMYADYFLPDGSLVLNGMNPGSESDLSGWPSYLTQPTGFNAAYPRDFVYNDTDWSIEEYSDQVVRDSRAVNPGQASADSADLSRFRARRGKVIMYHGVGDGLVPTRSTTTYYDRARAAAGGQQATDAFMRYFLVPGMNHCWFTPGWVNAPWMFSGAGQATALQLLQGTSINPPAEFTRGWGTPLFRGQVDYDALLKLVMWVEGGVAPDVIKAAAYTADWKVARTRKLCPYPKEAVLVDKTRVNEEAAWMCR